MSALEDVVPTQAMDEGRGHEGKMNERETQRQRESNPCPVELACEIDVAEALEHEGSAAASHLALSRHAHAVAREKK